MAADSISITTVTNATGPAVSLPSVRITATPAQGSPVDAILGLEPLVIGTSPECDLVVTDTRVSRRHCEIRLTPRGISFLDLGSKNGAFLGEIPIVEIILPVGVAVTIGNTRVSACVVGAPSLIPVSPSEHFGEAIGRSISMRALFAKLERVAATSETILLLGESGTGKEVLAHGIHTQSPRKDGPFVVFDCSAIAPNLIEAELFGHVRGAFTGAAAPRAGLLEQADGGTLFIDEIGELPLDLQPKLLRVLEARKVRRIGSNDWVSFDTRVVAATHKNLRAQVSSGAFRQDLYYRLAVVEVNVPSLRERKEDIPLLVEHFLAQKEPRLTLANLPPHAMALLEAHSFPGNVRELRNTVARLVLFPDLAQEAFGLTAAPAPPDRPAPARDGAQAENAGLGGLIHLPLLTGRDAVIEQFERSYLVIKLREQGGNVSRTADAIGVSRQYLHRLIDKYGLRTAERF